MSYDLKYDLNIWRKEYGIIIIQGGAALQLELWRYSIELDIIMTVMIYELEKYACGKW